MTTLVSTWNFIVAVIMIAIVMIVLSMFISNDR